MLLPDKKKKKTRRFAYIQYTVYCTVIIYYYNCIVQFIITAVYTTRLYINTIQYIYNYTVYI